MFLYILVSIVFKNFTSHLSFISLVFQSLVVKRGKKESPEKKRREKAFNHVRFGYKKY